MSLEKRYVVVTDHIEANTGKDVSDALQALILDNPNRTLYFPDGEYVLAKPILTPANPQNSVSLELSAYAVLRASDDWTDTEAMVRLGAAEPFNNITLPGSNYYFTGGVIDGNGRANGISIDSGRETCIHHVSIKNTRIGIHIKWGVNNRSSDADVHHVNISGNNAADSIGVLMEGHDNTLTNMRIAGCHKGVCAHSGGNILRDIHPLYIYDGENETVENFLTSVAFESEGNDNYFDVCYSDQFCTAFSIGDGYKDIIDKSYIMWYHPCGKEVAYKARGVFNSVITKPSVNFLEGTENILLSVDREGGAGIIEYPIVNNESLMSDDTYKTYLEGRLLSRNH